MLEYIELAGHVNVKKADSILVDQSRSREAPARLALCAFLVPGRSKTVGVPFVRPGSVEMRGQMKLFPSWFISWEIRSRNG